MKKWVISILCILMFLGCHSTRRIDVSSSRVVMHPSGHEIVDDDLRVEGSITITF